MLCQFKSLYSASDVQFGATALDARGVVSIALSSDTHE